MFLIRRLYFKLTDLSWLVLSSSTIFLIILSTTILHVIEPETFKTPADSLWFTMTTILTVGYGDLYPTTLIGKAFTVIFLYIIGIGLFATFIGKAIDSLSLYRKRKESGEIMYEGKNHVVIIDWSHKAQNAIKEILSRDKKAEIVVIDNIEKLPIINERIHFVKGDASVGDVLRAANIQEAKAVLIFADDRIHDQLLTDGKSLMIAISVERIAPNVHTTVEIEREEHVSNFRHVKIDEFILSNETIAKMAVKTILD